MESNGAATRSRHRQTPSSERFLGFFTRPQSEIALGDELNEDDIFWTGADSVAFADHNHHSTPSSSSSSPSGSFNFHHHGHQRQQQPKNFGILAVLPESETRSVFNHKASISSSNSSSASSGSSSRMMIPKRPPLDRTATAAPTPSSSLKFHQSVPVNVPVLSEAVRRSRVAREFDDIDDDDDGGAEGDGDGEMLPPHELVAARQTPLVACSVLEGVGRTLKGRDLRQVRNAVWRKTGFLD